MWDVLMTAGIFLVGGLLTMVAGAVFIAAVFWMQNGGDDDKL